MITTVTTTTTTVMTTTAAASLALIAILSGPRAQQLSRALNIAILPLILVFVVTVAFKVADVLR
jgi:lysylphosphatidylglycerol synthetase-like protein (DUF2156 family)